MSPRGRFIAKIAAGAAVSLSGLVVVSKLAGGSSSAGPAIAVDVVDKNAISYVQFDVQLSDAEEGSFVVEVNPGAVVQALSGRW